MTSDTLGGSQVAYPKVLFDPGHGGRQPGTVAGGIKEKDIALPAVFLIAGHLQRLFSGAVDTKFTRTRNRFMTLQERVHLEHDLSPQLYVSIHCNSCEVAESASGLEVLYYSSGGTGNDIADAIVAAVTGSYPIHGDGLVQTKRIYVIRNTRAPAVLVELLFLNNTDDRNTLIDAAELSNLSSLVAQGIYDSRGVWV